MVEQGSLIKDPYAAGPQGQIYFKSCESMPEVKSNTVTLAILTPPYTNQADGKSLDKAGYMDFIKTVFTEIRRALKPDGSLVVVNTDLRDHARYNGGDKGYGGCVPPRNLDECKKVLTSPVVTVIR